MRSSLQPAPIGHPSRDRAARWFAAVIMGWSNARYAVVTASSCQSAWDTLSNMADPRHIAPAGRSVTDALGDPETGVLLTHADFDALVRELEALRSKHRSELAGRLREARAYGVSTDNDELHAVVEESAVDGARIARLEELVRLAAIVDAATGDGGAGLGSTVCVVDEKSRTTEYELVGRRSHGSERREVTLASPVGQALWGARPGDVVKVALPDGRRRTLRVLDVRHGQLAAGAPPDESIVRAA